MLRLSDLVSLISIAVQFQISLLCCWHLDIHFYFLLRKTYLLTLLLFSIYISSIQIARIHSKPLTFVLRTKDIHFTNNTLPTILLIAATTCTSLIHTSTWWLYAQKKVKSTHTYLPSTNGFMHTQSSNHGAPFRPFCMVVSISGKAIFGPLGLCAGDYWWKLGIVVVETKWKWGLGTT